MSNLEEHSDRSEVIEVENSVVQPSSQARDKTTLTAEAIDVENFVLLKEWPLEAHRPPIKFEPGSEAIDLEAFLATTNTPLKAYQPLSKTSPTSPMDSVEEMQPTTSVPLAPIYEGYTALKSIGLESASPDTVLRPSDSVSDDSNSESVSDDSSSDSDEKVNKRPRSDSDGSKSDAESHDDPEHDLDTEGDVEKYATFEKQTRGRKKKRSLSFSEVTGLGSDMFHDAAIGETHVAQAIFQPSNNRKHAFADILAAQPDEDARQEAKADWAVFTTAARNFGRNPHRRSREIVKPADGGNWRVEGMVCTLRPHQIIGTGFMRGRETGDQEPQGGILADQMGLGKTIMTLACILNGLPPKQVFPRATLIVVPASSVNQWHAEIRRHCISLDQLETNKLKYGVTNVRLYRGRQTFLTNNPVTEIESDDIVITTYEELIKGLPKPDVPKDMVNPHRRKEWVRDQWEAKFRHLHHCHFLRVCLDEAQIIKNANGSKSLACRMLKADHHWAITGTPVMNGAFEFFPLFDFIEHPQASRPALFTAKPTQRKPLLEALSKCMIRRTYANRLFGAALVSLPKTRHENVMLRFSALESEIYHLVEKRFVDYINERLLDSTPEQNTYGMLALLLRLRQLASHPLMVQHIISDLLKKDDIKQVTGILSKPAYQTGRDAALCKQLRLIVAQSCFKSKPVPAPILMDDLTWLEEVKDIGFKSPWCSACGCDIQDAEAYDDSGADTRQDSDLDIRVAKNKQRTEGKIDDWLDSKGQIWASAKTVYVKESIEAMVKESSKAKMIVFTQWMGMIKVLGKVCECSKWGYCEFTGSMNATEKSQALEEFQDDPEKRILLASMKSGGVGLNLTMASRVIHLDPWWNLAAEQQVFGRVYRIGQQDETHLRSTTVANTIEDRMLQIKHEKQVDINGIMKDHKKRVKLDATDLLGLFGQVVTDAGGRVQIRRSGEEDAG
ncbi:hypothetical protein MBLNU459_g1807t2 [Dothideomycetes sp. NU459]